MIFNKKILLMETFFFLFLCINVFSLNFTGSDNLELCIIEPSGVKTCLKNNDSGINVDNKDITLELHDTKIIKSREGLTDLVYNNVVEIGFLLIIVVSLIAFVNNLLN